MTTLYDKYGGFATVNKLVQRVAILSRIDHISSVFRDRLIPHLLH